MRFATLRFWTQHRGRKAVAPSLLALGALIALPAAVAAAEAGSDADATAVEGSPDALLLDQLTVTSTGAGLQRRRHPGNVSVLSTEDVDFVRPNLASDLLDRIPGIDIQPGSGLESITAIRSPSLTGGAGAGSFLYLEDGVPLRAPGFQNVNAFFDPIYEVSGGIEVVRGPASALYGSNAVHGLINFLTLPPGEEPANEVGITFGSHGFVNAYGTLSDVAQGEASTHGIRFTALATHDDGWRANSGFDQQKGQIRYDYEDARNTIRTTLSGMNLNQETASYADDYKHHPLAKENPNPEAYRDAWAFRFASRWEHDLNEDWTLSLTPYARSTYMDFLMHFLPGQPTEKNRHWSAGLQSRGYWDLEGGHQIIIGLDTDYTEGSLWQYQEGPNVFSYRQGLQYDYDVNALVVAPYVHTTWAIGPQTDLSAGFRLEYTYYNYTNHAPDGTYGRFLRIPDQANVYWDPTPKLGLSHTFSDEVTTFANLARGARAPQTTDLYRLQINETPNEAKSETIDSAEVGARGVLLGDVTYEISAYYMYKRNYYFRDANGFNVANGKTQHTGLEAELIAPLAFGFYFEGAGSYAWHTYDFDNDVSGSSNPTESISAGDFVDTAPKSLANVRLGYGFLEDRARVELEWQHMGAYWMDAANTQRYGGHDIFNLLGAVEVTEALRLFGRIENLFDEPYAERADYAFGSARYFPGEGRTFYAGTAFRF